MSKAILSTLGPTAALIALIVSGCGETTNINQQTQNLDEQISNTNTLPSGLKLRPDINWTCGQEQIGNFSGADNGHLYRFAARAGQRYTFALRGHYAPASGAAVAVFDQKHQRLAYAKQAQNNEAAVTLTIKQDDDLLIGVFALRPTANGDYRLRAVCEVSGLNERGRGQTDFITDELNQMRLLSSPIRFKNGEGALATAEEQNANSAERGPVQEADIYKIQDNILYYLNTYRGLLVVDISNAQAPRILSRLPIYGYPVEMFVQKNLVYALVRDALYLRTQPKEPAKFIPRQVSELVAIDVADLTQPRVLKRQEIIGQVREGVTRKVGDAIYVVSSISSHYYFSLAGAEEPSQREQAWVYSFNLADRQKTLELVDKMLIFEGDNEEDSSTTSVNTQRSFAGVTISATNDSLLIAQNWYKSGYVSGGPQSCGSSFSLQQAIVSLVDISDPAGHIRLHSRFETYGRLGDQFKQTYLRDAKTGRSYYYGIFDRREWTSNNCQGESLTRNTIEAWDLTDGAEPKRLSSLDFGKPNETVRGSLFDGARKVAYAITAQNQDPLYAIDLNEPRDLRVLSAIDGLSGDMNVFRFVGGQEQFIVGIGRDQSQACQGFGPNATPTNIAVSLIDVRDLNKIRLVQRRCVTVENSSGWGVWSEINFNLDQAHKLIALSEDGEKNIITVPVTYAREVTDPAGWKWYKSESAVGVLSWDLSKYNPELPPSEQQVLTAQTTIIQPLGEIRRTVIYSSGQQMLTMGDTQLVFTDIQDLTQPRLKSTLELAPYFHQALTLKGHLVEIVLTDPQLSNSAMELRIKPLSKNPEETPVLARLRVVRAERILPYRDKLIFLRQVARISGSPQSNYATEVEASIYDFSRPTSPRLAGQVRLPLSYLPYAAENLAGATSAALAVSDDPHNGLAINEHGLILLSNEWHGQSDSPSSKLIGLFLDQSAGPQVVTYPLASTNNVSYQGLVRDRLDPSRFFLNVRTELGERKIGDLTFTQAKYEAQHFSLRPDGFQTISSPFSLPGYLVGMSLAGPNLLMLAQENAYEQTTQADQLIGSPRLSLLTLREGAGRSQAELIDSRIFYGQQLNEIIVDDNRLLANASGNYFWPRPWGKAYWPGRRAPDGINELVVLNISNYGLAPLFSGDATSGYSQLLGVADDRYLLINLSGSVAVIDARTWQAPRATNYILSPGYASTLAVANHIAYLPAGYAGLLTLDLSASTRM